MRCVVSGVGFRGSGLRFRVMGSRFRVPGFGFRVPGFGFRLSGFEFRVSGSEFRVSGFGLRVSGFGCLFRFPPFFRVSGRPCEDLSVEVDLRLEAASVRPDDNRLHLKPAAALFMGLRTDHGPDLIVAGVAKKMETFLCMRKFTTKLDK